MTDEDVLDCISRALEQPKGSITMDSEMENVSNWDSFGHLNILVALDEKFSGNVASIEDMASADSIKKIFYLLKGNNLL
jgi:acyl carrier protein